MKKTSGEIEFQRFRIPYRIYGDAPRTILCLSGAKQTMSAWKSFISYFLPDYRVIVFDMPGQGRSEILSGSPRVSLEEQVAVVNQIVEAARLDQDAFTAIAGASWGAVLAAAYLDRYPEVFERALLGSFGTKPNMVLKSVIKQVQQLIEAGRAKDIAPMMLEQFGQYIPENLKRQILSQFDRMSDAQFRSFYEHSVHVTELEDLNHYVQLENIQAHTLVIMGQFDTIMDLFDTRKAAEMIPNGEYHLVKGAGHFLHWEKESILDVYRDFLERDMSRLQEVASD